ncbi:MAG: AI-2E family transporter [Akkermansiaceae bacterium]|nr:AI-2E family transporter [Akkermansiaceae bacterium]NNM30973.1 AI-2E family transporter [Akkermansiaceae bacterium]
MRSDSLNAPRAPRSILFAAQLASVLMICAILYWAQFILVPIVLAVLCSFVLYPGVRFLERHRVGRMPAVAMVLAVAFAILGALGWIFGSQLAGLVGDVPEYRENIRHKISTVRAYMTGSTITQLQQTIREVGEEFDRDPGTIDGTPVVPTEDEEASAVPVKVVAEDQFPEFSLEGLGPYVNTIFTIGLMVILTALFLTWREDLVERLVGLAGHTRMVITTHAVTDAGSRISRYLGLQFAVNLAYGAAASLGLYLLDIPYAVVWGGFAGLLRYIPYLGSILGTLSAVLAALVTTPGWEPVLLALLLYVFLDITTNVLEPFIFGAGVGVSTLAVLLTVVFLGWLWGPVGAILGTPFAVCLVVLGEHVPGLAFLSWLMSKQPRLEPHANFYHRLLRQDLDGAAQVLAESYHQDDSEATAIETIVVPTLEQALADLRGGALAAGEVHRLGVALCDILDDMDHEPLPAPDCDGENCRLLVCPPVSMLDQAAVSALAWAQPHIPAELCFSRRGRLVSEVLEDLNDAAARGIVVVASARDEKRQVERWRLLLDQAGLDLPLVLFSWTTAADAGPDDRELREAGAAAVARGLDPLVAWIRGSLEEAPGEAAPSAAVPPRDELPVLANAPT